MMLRISHLDSDRSQKKKKLYHAPDAYMVSGQLHRVEIRADGERYVVERPGSPFNRSGVAFPANPVDSEEKSAPPELIDLLFYYFMKGEDFDFSIHSYTNSHLFEENHAGEVSRLRPEFRSVLSAELYHYARLKGDTNTAAKILEFSPWLASPRDVDSKME